MGFVSMVGALLLAMLVPEELLWSSMTFYFLASLAILLVLRARRLSALEAALQAAAEEHERLYGTQSLVRESASRFGEGFGEGYAEAAADDGDIGGVLIGKALKLGAKALGDATKTKAERDSEAQLHALVAEQQAIKSRAVRGILALLSVCWFFAHLRETDVLPSLDAAPVREDAPATEWPPPAPPSPAPSVESAPPKRITKKAKKRTPAARPAVPSTPAPADDPTIPGPAAPPPAPSRSDDDDEDDRKVLNPY